MKPQPCGSYEDDPTHPGQCATCGFTKEVDEALAKAQRLSQQPDDHWLEGDTFVHWGFADSDTYEDAIAVGQVVEWFEALNDVSDGGVTPKDIRFIESFGATPIDETEFRRLIATAEWYDQRAAYEGGA